MAISTSMAKVQNLVGERIKCTLDDGRHVTGTFLCLDRLSNIVLSNAGEERTISSADYSDTTHEHIIVTRNLCQAMIPGERLRKIEVDASTFQSRVAVLDS